MRVSDLVEALTAADKIFQSRHKVPMEIFDLTLNDDEYEGNLSIHACKEVVYQNDIFGYGEKTGRKPLETIIVNFECQDGKIEDRSVYFKDEEDE